MQQIKKNGTGTKTMGPFNQKIVLEENGYKSEDAGRSPLSAWKNWQGAGTIGGICKERKETGQQLEYG